MKYIDQILPTFLRKYNHHLLIHHPWLWETKVVPFGFMGLCFTLASLAYYLYLTANQTFTPIWFVCSWTSSMVLFILWFRELGTHNSLRDYAQVGKHMMQGQFLAYFGISLLLLFPILIGIPHHFSSNGVVVYTIECYLGIALIISTLIYVVKHAGIMALLLQMAVLFTILGVFIYLVSFIHPFALLLLLIIACFLLPFTLMGLAYVIQKAAKMIKKEHIIQWSPLLTFGGYLLTPIVIYYCSIFVLDGMLITALFSYHSTRFLAILITIYTFVAHVLPKAQHTLLQHLANPRD